MKRSFILIVSLLFLFTLLQLDIGYANENHTNKNQVTFFLSEPISINVEGDKVVTLNKGISLFGSRLETGDIEIQIHNNKVTLSKDKIIEKNNSDRKVEFDPIKYSEVIEVTKNTNFFNKEGENSGTIYKGTEISVNKDESKRYVVIGNRRFYLGSEVDIEDKNTSVKEQEINLDKDNNKIEENKSNNNHQTNIQKASLDSNISFSQTNYFKANNTNISVYIRSADGSLNSVGQLNEGKSYHIISDYGNWHRIMYGNEYAYVWKDSTIPTKEAPNTSAQTKAKKSAEIIQDVTVYDNSNGKLTEIGTINKNSLVNYIEQTGNWYKINFGGRKGYIYKSGVKEKFTSNTKYFSVEQENVTVYQSLNGSLVSIGKLSKGEKYQIASNYGDWHKIQYGDTHAFVWKAATRPSSDAPSKSTNVEGSIDADIINNVTVYDNSNGGLKPIGIVVDGSNITYIRRTGNWFEVNFGGRIGYIYKSGVKEKFTSNTKYFSVKQENVMVYKSSNGHLLPIAKLTKAKEYRILSNYGDWHKIQYGDAAAFVWKAATRPSSDAPNKSTNAKGNMKAKVISNVTVYDNTNQVLEPIGEITGGSNITYIRRTGNWYEINFGGRKGYIYKNGVKPFFDASINYFKVNRSDVTLYKRIDGNLTPIGKLKQGQVFKRYRNYGDWHQIKIGNEYGYVWKPATLPDTGKSINNIQNSRSSNVAITAKSPVTVYDNSSGSLKPMGVIYEDSRITLVRNSGNWIEVNFSGRTGFIYRQAVDVHFQSIVSPKTIYTYEQMEIDLRALANIYPNVVKLRSIGKSLDGRNIYALKLGNGKKELFFNGSHHAREHMTTNVLMEMIDKYAYNYTLGDYYSGYNVRDILNNTSIWFVPMVNPDGVTLNQKGISGLNNSSYANLVFKLNGYSYDFSEWKANARGVDLNRQYPAGWENIKWSSRLPGFKNYKGDRPLSEPAVQSIYNFTNNHDFETAVAYHSSGEIIYWYYNQSDQTYYRDKSIAARVKNITGYNLVSPQPNPSGGGFKDWFVQEKGLPGLTVEISPYTYQKPVPLYNWDSIWRENKTVGLELAKEVIER